MTIAGQTFTVTQAGAPCTYASRRRRRSRSRAAAGTGSVTVTAGDWLRVDGGEQRGVADGHRRRERQRQRDGDVQRGRQHDGDHRGRRR